MVPRDPWLSSKEGFLDTTLYAITEIRKEIYAPGLATMLLVSLESSSTPEFPEPHSGKDEGKAKEKVSKGGCGYASSNDSSFVVHHDCFAICAVMGEPPIRHQLKRKDD
jgi:hypothetical protein